MNEIKYEYNGDLNTPFLVVTENVRRQYKSLNLMHFHKQMQMILVLQGTAILETLYEKILLNKNDIAFINTNVYHKITLAEDELKKENKYFSIIFDEKILNVANYSRFKSEFIDKYSNIKIKINKSPIVREALSEILTTTNEYGVRALMSYIWYNLIIKDDNDNMSATDYINESLEKILRYIDENYHSQITLDKLCKVGNFSKSGMHRIFIKHLGISPYTYIVEYRLNQSIKMLENTDMNVSEISLAVGYDSTSQFIKLFRNYIGKTPLKYRKNRKVKKFE